MKRVNIFLTLTIILTSSLFFFSCAGIQDAITNAQRLQFRLGNISNMKVGDVSIGNKKSVTDFNLIDGATLLSAFTSGKLNTSFTLNLIAKNPNDGKGGAENSSAVIKSLAWRLFIDDSEFINGNIGDGITIPGLGQETTIPIQMGFDLLSFLKGDNFEKIMKLAFALGGKEGSSARVKLRIKPTVDTFLGPISYPGEITVVDKEFRAQ